jgi:hypothetical protein
MGIITKSAKNNDPNRQTGWLLVSLKNTLDAARVARLEYDCFSVTLVLKNMVGT